MMNWKPISLVLLSALVARADVIVFSASSMTEVMQDLAAEFEKSSDEKIRFNFSSSGALARQIEAGAPADVFISAHTQWMDGLEEKEAGIKTSRFNLAANRLVLVALKGSKLKFDGQVEGKIAVGDFRSVPAGIYAKEALEYMGWFNHWKPHLIQTANVRTALLYVQRNEVAAGIVYATDAQAAELPIIGTFPEESHRSILYPAAALSEKPAALQFLEFLKSDKAKAILKQHRFKNTKE